MADKRFSFPTPKVPDNVKDSLRLAFNEIDTNSDGRIDEDELLRGLKRNGHTFSKRVVHRMMMSQLYQADEVKIGALNFDQFVSLSAFLASMKNAFDSLDGDKNGCIDDKELGSGLVDLGFKVSLEQVKLLMAIVDKDTNGTVEFSEYVDLTFYLIFFSYITQTLSQRNIETFEPKMITELCGLAGVELSEEGSKSFIEKNKGKPATFNDFLGLLVVSQLKK